MLGQIGLGLVLDVHPLALGEELQRVLARLGEDRVDPGVGVEQVDGRVALKREHFVEREPVVGGPVALEVGVLDGAVAHGRRGLIELLVADIRAPLLDGRLAPNLGLVQELDEPDDVAAPAPELLAVLAEDQAERHVVDLDLPIFGQVAGLAGGLEHHLKVDALSGVGDVDDPVGVLLLDAVLDGGHIGGGVPVPAVRLPHNQRNLLALDEHACGALTDLGDVPVEQVVDDVPEERVVERLAPLLDGDAQTVVKLLEFPPGSVTDALPSLHVLLLAALELPDGLPGPRLEVLLLIEPLLGGPVEDLQVGDILVAGRVQTLGALLRDELD